ncbi:MAG: excinuclease ABC subunit UvrC [Clostridia bacterium]|nr:excinuclease ABC subunit UvrC [Clostridia bacterium]
MTLEELKEKAHRLPTEPGVYLMHDKTGAVIYVGKAKSLRNRVSQYFADLASHTVKTRKLVSQIDWFETIFAKTELDALLLENTLIKRYKPKYNILLKDDKGYPFLRLDPGPYGRFSVVSRRAQDGARYFGPYGGRGTANQALRLLTETFGLPTCSRQFPRDFGKERPCLRYQLGKCWGICRGTVSAEEYRQRLEEAALVLEGKTSDLEARLTEQMERHAEALEFEQAAACRDRLKALAQLRRNNVTIVSGGADSDILAFACKGTRGILVRLSYSGGVLLDRTKVFFEGAQPEDGADILESYLKQWYGQHCWAPREICISREIEDAEAVEAYLSAIRGGKCRITVPQRGEKRRQMDLALENAKLELQEAEVADQHRGKSLNLLAEALELETPPQRMEAFDISNTAGDQPVASMTVFQQGKPLKSAYKKFKIKTVEGGDDYGAMAEVMGRRLDRALAGDAGFLPLPDLFLMDGGQGQVRVAKAELDARGLDIPVYGMVKDDRHRTRALVDASGREIGIAATPALFSLIGRIQEETHRFAVEFHQTLRSKQARQSRLEQIPGVGEARRKQLLKAFGSVKAIAEAEEEMLAAVVPRPVAQAIVAYFKEKSQ